MNDHTVDAASLINNNVLESGYKVNKLPSSADTNEQLDDKIPLILLAACKPLQEQIQKGLAEYNYNIVVVNISTDDNIQLIPDINRYKPDIILIDHVLLDDSLKFSLDIIQNFSCFKPIPIIFLSKSYNTKKHLAAVSAGGSAFLTSPIDINTLISTIDNLCEIKETPFTVSIIDDDAASSAYYAAILDAAGINTNVITSPLNAITELMESPPDLILLDLYMPECTGQELAAMIRQKEYLFNIPISFLSGETDIDKQLVSTKQGIDDFLIKNMSPKHFIMAVRSRITRSKQLKSLMTKDSLTGLLNRQAFQERLDSEIARSNRSGNTLCLAMLDLDHFKQVNDKYGHIEGDRALKFLSIILRRWLRFSDVIGRFGGEEFLVLMPDTKKIDAFYLIERVRQAYSEHIHSFNGEKYSVTFSAGVTSMEKNMTGKELIRIADESMYTAKNTGRNKVAVT